MSWQARLVRFGTPCPARITAADKCVRWIEQAGRAHRLWFGTRHKSGDGPVDVTVDARADYERDKLTPCSILILLEGHEPLPAELQRAIREARWLRGPTIAHRNRSLRALGVPEKPLKFIMSCRITANGGVGSCLHGDDDPYRNLAAHWGLDFELALENKQADDYRFFDVELPITMGPDDIRTVDVSTGRRLELAQLVVIRGTQLSLGDFYTEEMRRLKSGANVPILCKVQEDGSVLCDLKPGAVSPPRPFVDAAIALGERLEVKTELRDGTSAVGGLIERTIKFEPP